MRRTRLSLAALTAATIAVVGLPTVASATPHGPSKPVAPAADVPVQLLTVNDFHGRINQPTGDDGEATAPGADGLYGTADDAVVAVGGAASLDATIDQATADFVADGGAADDSLLIGLGDVIGASPFESSVFRDESTLEVANALGMDVSVVGNHEFDRGTDELRRVSGATDGTATDDVTACEGVEPGVTGCFTDSTGEPFAGAEFPYLAANVVSRETGEPMLPAYSVVEVGGGKKLGFIGVVTDTTPTIVSPSGIADVEFVDEAEAINRYVPELQAQGVEAIVALVHEGGENPGTDATDPNGCDQLTGPIVDINAETVSAVDLIVSAHSHQGYNCMLSDPDGQPRLVTQAEYYGRMFTDIRLVLDGRTGDVDRLCADYRAGNVLNVRNAEDPEIDRIVDYWTAQAAEAGDRVVGEAAADIRRAGTLGPDGVFVPVRDGESALGNLVAEMQLAAIQADPSFGAPVVAFMNPGGLRTDILAGETTYAELFNVQPFGNTVNVVTLTGADIRAVLEQQFQANGGPRGNTLRLGTSEGFSYRYDLSHPYGQRVDPASITLDGEVVDPAASYRVVANSFLIGGGDAFTAFTNGTDPATGPVDVDTAVAYFEANSPVAPPAADHGQAATFPAPEPAAGLGGSTVEPTPATTVDGTSGLNGPGQVGPGCDATASISDDTPFRGDRVTVTGTAFAPGEKVTVRLSNGAKLGTVKADRNGNVTATGRVPLLLPAGEHTVTLTGASGETASDTFTLDPYWLELVKRLKLLFGR
ncbi:bifunctional metallophosphatase/5'-nucleotidase [Modestobacter italicus]|uniref:bifunctional metallophosphatase/5'-nucleotidase n=1 Tax=Modestobacter italicus (strain DSM 44449 / CECT 9708 / BC 501) TaxID=2732864 RepID=UPI001C95E30C|nr:bifunctional metallophosphatase/5'-nucleotidase [Modestobacter italicus]